MNIKAVRQLGRRAPPAAGRHGSKPVQPRSSRWPHSPGALTIRTMQRGRLTKRLLSPACVLALLGLPHPISGEDFEVIVLRGSEIVRVTGDESGALSEFTIREAPEPAAPSAPEDPADEPRAPGQLIVLYFEDPIVVSGFRSAPIHRSFGRQRGPHRFHQPRGLLRREGGLRGRATFTAGVPPGSTPRR